MIWQILIVFLSGFAVFGMWWTARTWDQKVAAALGTAAWIILLVIETREVWRYLS